MTLFEIFQKYFDHKRKKININKIKKKKIFFYDIMLQGVLRFLLLCVIVHWSKHDLCREYYQFSKQISKIY